MGVWSNYCTDAAQLELAMQVLTAAMTVHYLVWATVVIRQISAELDIYVFLIRKSSKKD